MPKGRMSKAGWVYACLFHLLSTLHLSHQVIIHVNPCSATRCDPCYQNKVKVKGLGRKSLHLAGF